ncbi:MAG: polysaccharide deacetylase family protein [Lacunisphaera sp.]
MGLLLIIALAGKVAAVIVGWREPAVALTLWFGPDLLIGYHVFVPNAQGVVRMHRRFRTTEREVWLTIDDGPDPDDTPRILALLAEHGARATFFVIGEKAARHPGIIRAIAAAGHEVGHHTQTHPLATFWCAGPARTARELDATLEVLRPLSVRPWRFRPPAGIKNPWLAPALRERSLTAVGWSARGLELWPGNAVRVAERTLRDLAPGAILLLHEGPRVPPAIRVTAIGEVLAGLRAAGYRCVIPQETQLG